MGRAAFGIGWLLWRQNRVGLIGLAAGLALLLGALRLYAGTHPSGGIKLLSVVILGYSLLFLAGLGCLNLFSNEQSFKPYLFTLPIKSRSLVLWHMAYPILAAIVVWLVGAWIMFVPSAGAYILWWPSALIAAFISIWQAALWYPAVWYLRPVFIVLGFAAPAFLLGQAWIRDMPIETISLCLLPAVPIAALIAVGGVERSRRGRSGRYMPNLGETGLAGVAIDHAIGLAQKRPRRPFRSGQVAQLWLEWRTNGIVLPVMTAVTYLVAIPIATLVEGELGAGFTVGDLGIGHIQTYSALRWGFIFIPGTAMLLSSVGAGLYHGTVRRDGMLEPFYATRAMTSWNLVVAKIGSATQSSLATWAVTLFLVGLWLLLPASVGVRHGTLAAMLLYAGPPRAALYALAALLVLMLWCWRAQVCAFYIALSGRRWLSWAASGIFLLQAVVIGYLHLHPSLAREVARLLPNPAVALAIVKPVLGGLVFAWLRRRNLASVSALARVAAGWLLAAAALGGFLVWLLPPALAPARSIIAGVVLLLPIVRPALAPLALDWNRHR